MDRRTLDVSNQFKSFRDGERGRYDQMPAVVGDGHGRVNVDGFSGLIWVRLYGDGRRRVRCRDAGEATKIEGTPILVGRVLNTGLAIYRYLGRDDARAYSSDPQTDLVKAHAPQHEVDDFAVSGYDPVFVTGAAVKKCRLQANDPPDLTAYITAGPYIIDNIWYEWPGGVTDPFTIPADHRWDLVYLGTDLLPHILQGSDMPDPPTKPALPAGVSLVGWVLLNSASTVIADTMIASAKTLGESTSSIAGANPTAQVGPAAINGAAATFMRSDAAPKLADTAVTPGTYGDASHVAQVTVDQQGRLTAAASVAMAVGSGHLHALMRWISAGLATFDLPDVAEYIDSLTNDGAEVDALTYSLSADRSQIIFDVAPTATNLIQARYVVAVI